MTALGDLYWVIRGDTDTLEKDIDKSVKQTSRQLEESGRKATRNATVPLVAFAAAGVKAYGDLNIGLREVVTLTGEVGDAADATFNEFQGHVDRLSDSLGVAQTELVDGLYSSLSAGVPRGNVVEFLEVATKAAIAGKATTEEAVDGITSAINAFGLEFDEATRVADVFFSTVKLGKTTLPEIAAVIGRIAPQAKLAGVSLEEVGAGLSTLTANGLNTAEAATQIRAGLVALTKPSEEMTAVWEEYGYASGQAAIEQLGLQGAMQVVFDAANGDIGTLTELLGRQEAVGATAIIAGAGQQKFADDLAAAATSAGAAADAFGEIDKARDFQRLVNDIRNLAIEAGQTLTPVAQGAAAVLREVIGLLEQLPTAALVGFGAVAAAVGPVQILVSKLLDSRTGLRALQTLQPLFARTLGSTSALPITLALGAATAAVVAWRSEAAKADRDADAYIEALAEAEGGNDALARALERANAGLDEQSDGFSAGTEAATTQGEVLESLLEKWEELERFSTLFELGFSFDDLARIGNGEASSEEIERFGRALGRLSDAGALSDAEIINIYRSLGRYSDAAENGAQKADQLAKAQLDQAVADGIITQQMATRLEIAAELADRTGALAETTEEYFALQERIASDTAAYANEFGLPPAPTIDWTEWTPPASLPSELDRARDSMVELSNAAGSFAELGPSFYATVQAGRAAGEELARSVFAEIGDTLEDALTGVLDIDTDNGVNDVQDAINNITGAVDGAEESLRILDDRVAAIERLKELGPELGIEFENLISQIATGAGDGLLDDILYGEGGTTPDLLADLEASLSEADALRAKLQLEVDDEEIDAYTDAFREGFLDAATAGLDEFALEIVAANESERLKLEPAIDVDEPFQAMLDRFAEANPTLTVQVEYVDGFGINIAPPEPGFVYGTGGPGGTPNPADFAPDSLNSPGGGTNIDIEVNMTSNSDGDDVAGEIVRGLTLAGVAPQ